MKDAFNEASGNKEDEWEPEAPEYEYDFSEDRAANFEAE